MKICILTTGHSPFDSRIFYKQANSLKKICDDITIIGPYDKEFEIVSGIKIKGIPKPKDLKGRFFILDLIIEKAIEERADIYHFHDFEIIYKALKIKRKLPNSKIIYDVHEHYPDMVRMSKKVPKPIRALTTLMVDKSELYISKKFDFIITADEAVKDRFNNISKSVEVIHNYTQFNAIKNDLIKKEYDIIYQGGITIERGALQILKAIKILKSNPKYENIKMVFVGPFGYAKCKDILMKYISDNDLESNIIFTGRVDHDIVREYMYKSKIGLVPLLPEPKYFKNIPTKQFEYMSCGIPVIGSYMPPIKRYITAYNSGIVINPLDEVDIAENIAKLLMDEDLIKCMGDNGIKAISEEFNWKQEEEKLINIYKVLGGISNEEF